MKTNHSGDCTIFRSVINGRPYDGICTCGYGWQEATKVHVINRDESLLVSEERAAAHTEYKLGVIEGLRIASEIAGRKTYVSTVKQAIEFEIARRQEGTKP